MEEPSSIAAQRHRNQTLARLDFGRHDYAGEQISSKIVDALHEVQPDTQHGEGENSDHGLSHASLAAKQSPEALVTVAGQTRPLDLVMFIAVALSGSTPAEISTTDFALRLAREADLERRRPACF